MTVFTGTAGGDAFEGTPDADEFKLWQGGDDKANGNGGADEFRLGSALTALDLINGGDGEDTVYISGNYSDGISFGALTLVAVEKLVLGKDFSYDLTTHDGTVAAGELFTVDGAKLTATDTIYFDGTAETDGRFRIDAGAGNDILSGGAGNDRFTGSGGSDRFLLSMGGQDKAYGGGGDDSVFMNNEFTKDDVIHGGLGMDTLNLLGDYAGANGVTFGSNTVQGIETIVALAGHDYELVTHNVTVAVGATLNVHAGNLGAANHLFFNGGAETDGDFDITAGDGNDTLTGGTGADTFDTGLGTDVVFGGAGADTIVMGAGLNAADAIDGGGGPNTVEVDGDYSGGVTFNAATLTNIGTIVLAEGHTYKFTTSNGTVAAATELFIAGFTLDAGENVTFNGAAETDGEFHIVCGKGSNTLTGGAGADTFDVSQGATNSMRGGGGGDDYFLSPTGADTIRIGSVSDSTSGSMDDVGGFKVADDKFDFNFAVTSVSQANGTMNSATMDADIASLIGSGLTSGKAYVVSGTGGTLSGHTFIVVSGNGTAGYQAGGDYLIDITGVDGAITTAHFI